MNTPSHNPAPRMDRYWRSLDELSDSPAWRRWVSAEFPEGVAAPTSASRRSFLKAAGATIALAALPACSRREQTQIVPPVRTLPSLRTRRAYATTLTRSGYGRGVLVTAYEGRPIKIEGNPDHPASLGATDVFDQAATLELADPARVQSVTGNAAASTWDLFARAVRPALGDGSGVRILSGRTTSPTLARMLRRFLDRYPGAKWHVHEPIDDGAMTRSAPGPGPSLQAIYDLSRARVILSLDCDFLWELPGSVRYARDFARQRRTWGGPEAHELTMNRLYAAESSISLTGAKADHRLALPPAGVGAFARALGARLDITGFSTGSNVRGVPASFIEAVAADLREAGARAVVIPGRSLPPDLHALADAINASLGSSDPGGCVRFIASPTHHDGLRPAPLRSLVEDALAGRVATLIILDSNPLHTAPAGADFRAALRLIPTTVSLALRHDETARRCGWVLPLAHELESWGDARAFDGAASIVQPLIEPLYAGRSAAEVLSLLVDDVPRAGHDLVRETWRADGRASEGDFERWWRSWLKSGVVADSAFPSRPIAAPAPPPAQAQPEERSPGRFDLLLRPDYTTWDGSFAHNAWLQEIPDPITKLCWGNALLMSPRDAERLGLDNGRVVEISSDAGILRAPAWITPGHADACVSLSLGRGRASGGIGDGVGVSAYALRTSEQAWMVRGVTLTPTRDRVEMTTTQHHAVMEGRDLVREGTLAEFRESPHAPAEPEEKPLRLSLYQPWSYTGRQWGMSIDLTACIGCNACTIACQAENNIPAVGAQQVRAGREMHWIRVDRYYVGDPHAPGIRHQPVPCMHCENAPCELVCPVGATQHSADGLNEMVYNRCFGTRYCSNNCPYKVRRFNFLQFADKTTESLRVIRNPGVTVRARGVMEKCTYCVQRIRRAEIESRIDGGAPIPDSTIQTACQQVCPTRAITFGDINDAGSRVSLARKSPLDYSLLGELNTRPRTTYLARISNPHPSLAGEG